MGYIYAAYALYLILLMKSLRKLKLFLRHLIMFRFNPSKANVFLFTMRNW